MIKTDLGYSFKLHLYFAFAIIATTFTKLRGSEEENLLFIHDSIALGEILFVLTILGLTTFKLNKNFFLYIFYFLLLTLITILLNFFINSYIADHDDVVHDLMALIVNMIFLSVLINNDKISISDLLDALYIVTSIYFLLIFISGVILNQGFFYWHYNIDTERISGLARNPNQISLLVLMLTGLSLHYFDNAKKIIKKIFHISIFLLSIIISIYVASDALILGIIALISFYILFKLPKYFSLLSILLLLVAFSIVIMLNIDSVENYFSNSFQTQERFARWLSFGGLLPQVFLLGFGPGGHGPSFDDSFKFIVGLPMQDTEFHNSFLDFFSQYGILSGGFILVLYVYYLLKLNNRQLYLFIAIAIGAFVLSFFHMYTRQPLFWLLALMPFIYKYKEQIKSTE